MIDTPTPPDIRHEGRRFAINSNALWIMGERILRMITGFGVGILSARIFAPEMFGLLSWAMGVVSLATPLLTQGLDVLIPRDLIRKPDQKPKLYAAAMTMKLVGVVAAFLSASAMALFLRAGDWYSLMTVLILLAGQAFQALDVFEYGFIARDDRKTPAIVRTVFALGSTAGKLCVLFLAPNLMLFALFISIDVAAGYLTLTYIEQHKYQAKLDFRLCRGVVRELRQEAAWSLAAAFASMLFLRVDQIVVEYLLGPAKLGIYAAAVRLSEVSTFVPVAIAASIYPALIRMHSTQALGFDLQYRDLIRRNVWLAIFIASATASVSHWLVPILYGEAYADAASILSVYAWGLVPIAVNQCVGKWLVIHGKISLHAAFQAVGAFVNIALNILIIPRLGLLGAAWVTIFSYTFSSVFMPLMLPSTRPSILLILLSKGALQKGKILNGSP